jgi:hypothetical protein
MGGVANDNISTPCSVAFRGVTSDLVRREVWQNSGGSLNVLSGEDKSFLSVAYLGS